MLRVHVAEQVVSVPVIPQVVQGTRWQQYSDADKQAVAERVAAWCFGGDAPCARSPGFVANKAAQLFAHLAGRLYPANLWSTCFQDMLNASAQGAQQTAMFLRIMLALDQDIIALDVPRNDAEARRSMALKDALRERDIASITQAWTQIVEQHASSAQATELAQSCLAAVQRYADWVDIHLIASERFVHKLLALLQGAMAIPHVPWLVGDGKALTQQS
jgi:Exportin 1-like protein